MHSGMAQGQAYLHRHGREHAFLQTIELVKAAPSPTLYQAHEDSAHAFYINTLIAIEYQHLVTK